MSSEPLRPSEGIPDRPPDHIVVNHWGQTLRGWDPVPPPKRHRKPAGRQIMDRFLLVLWVSCLVILAALLIGLFTSAIPVDWSKW